MSRKDLDQVEEYVDWARSNLLGTGDHAPKAIRGLLIVGKLSSSGVVQRKIERLEGDGIRVETYGDLVVRARKVAQLQRKRVQKIAPEFLPKAAKRKVK